MPLDESSLTRLDEALLAENEEVRDRDRFVRRRSVKELLQARDAVRAQVEGSSRIRKIRLVNDPGC